MAPCCYIFRRKRVNVDFPTWLVDSLDRKASKLVVTRQSVIKVWLAARLEATASKFPLKIMAVSCQSVSQYVQLMVQLKG
jgi:hypothetical protein